MQLVLLAPSGAGKSTLARAGVVRDVDHLPKVEACYKLLAKRWGERWWERSDYKESIRPAKSKLVADAMVEQLDPLRPPLATAEQHAVELMLRRGDIEPRSVLVWLPSAAELTVRQAARRGLTQPKNTEATNQKWRDGYLAFAREWGIRVTAMDVLA